MIWLTGGALVLCILMIIGLVSLVVYNGSRAFWPQPISRVELLDGSTFLGIRVDHEQGTEESTARSLYQVGNRDIGQESFRWVDDSEVESTSEPDDVVMLERQSWGAWFGVPERIMLREEEGAEVVLADGAEEAMAAFDEYHEQAIEKYESAEHLREKTLGEINRRIERQRVRVRGAEYAFEQKDKGSKPFPIAAWLGVVGMLGVCVGMYLMLSKRASAYEIGVPAGLRVGRFGVLLIGVSLLIAALIGSPWRGVSMDADRLGGIRADAANQERMLLVDYERVLEEIHSIEAEDAKYRFVVIEQTGGRFAPVSQTQSDEPMRMSQVVRMVPANRLGFGDKLGVYFSRWWEYLSTGPREANTEGGVYPVIVGTVLLTLMLTIFVTPLGVIAALYLREYAKQGLVTSLIRIAVNNLAGVPSIVYGVFGLGFFCYTLGQYVDTGVSKESSIEPSQWWMVYASTTAAGILGYATGVLAKPNPGKAPVAFHRWMKRCSLLVWGGVVVLVAVLIFRTPYFEGFFAVRAMDGSPTFGARGLLWASLTLALLTLPVVIVATEEAIAAVPNSMREGSYGCGASKWQTMRRVVIPGAMPGILTGAILAMARGAGEVAPLMLVGAVKLNEDLPISSSAPYLHADRSFMHLGFHIYDLGFQSPDSQAARPLVWTTILLFLSLILALNMIAIVVRARIRARMIESAI